MAFNPLDHDKTRRPHGCATEKVFKHEICWPHEADPEEFDRIKDHLSKHPIKDFDSLKLFLNSKHSAQDKEYDLKSLEMTLMSLMTDEERKDFFSNVIPFMTELLLETPTISEKKTIFVLGENMNGSVKLSKLEAACILVNSFFCTFHRPSIEQFFDLLKIPSINFDFLFGSKGNIEARVAKIRMLINYFSRIRNEKWAFPILQKVSIMQSNSTTSSSNSTTSSNKQDDASGVVSTEKVDGYDDNNNHDDDDDDDDDLIFTRIYVKDEDIPNWGKSKKPLCDFEIIDEGTIEDCGDALQADFANMFIGGGALGYGCVQEEIRFVINPELICSRLFCEKMNDNEAIFMKGAEQYSSYKGYARSLAYGGDFKDTNIDPKTGKIQTEIIALDALMIMGNPLLQFKKTLIDRELKKAYVAYHPEYTFPKVSTGNWGCGAFRGDKQLKFVIQWLAISEAKIPKKMMYYVFSEKKTGEELRKIAQILKSSKIATVGSVYDALCNIKVETLTYPFILHKYLEETFSK